MSEEKRMKVRKGIERTKASGSLIIVLIGLILILSYFILMKELKLIQEMQISLFNVGLAILSVGLVTLIWELLGGDPISAILLQIENRIRQNAIGVEKVDLRSRDYNYRQWLDLAKDAKEIDLMGIILWDHWFESPDFIELICKRLSPNNPKKPHVRIIVLKPFSEKIEEKDINQNKDIIKKIMRDSKILFHRAFDEELGKQIWFDNNTQQLDKELSINKIIERGFEEMKRMSKRIDDTLLRLRMIQNKISSHDEYFKFKVSSETYPCCSVMRFDDEILVVHYLHQTGGSNSPILEVKGKKTAFYKLYRSEFERVWALGSKWDCSNNR